MLMKCNYPHSLFPIILPSAHRCCCGWLSFSADEYPFQNRQRYVRGVKIRIYDLHHKAYEVVLYFEAQTMLQVVWYQAGMYTSNRTCHSTGGLDGRT